MKAAVLVPPGVIAAGIDEVGRGCLAGPVYAAVVILPPRHGIAGLNDSKKLSADQREALAPRIREQATAWAIGVATVEEIDRLNILRATFLAMRRAVDALPQPPQLCLVDGNQVPELGVPVRTVIGGDATVEAIMAASIIAKVARDAELVRLHDAYPHYGFARHKGYGTPEHLAALRRHGPCVIHRMSFTPCAQSSLQLQASASSMVETAASEILAGTAEPPPGVPGNWTLDTGN